MGTSFAAPLALALTLGACAAFSAGERAGPPPSDAGVKASDGAGGACDEPVVVTAGTPPETSCVGDGLTLENDPRNCGACGHSCFDARCTKGLCDPEALGQPAAAMSLDGQTLYLAREGEVTSVALDRRDAIELPFVSGILGGIRAISARGAEVYVSTDSQQYAIDVASKELRQNAHVVAVPSSTPNGLFFPGTASAHYVFGPAPDDERIARISVGGNVELTPPGAFDAFGAFAQRGDALFWTALLGEGSGIFGPFDRAEPIFRSSSVVKALAVDDEHAYFGDDQAKKVFRVATASPGAAQPIAEGKGRVIALAVNGGDVFYATDWFDIEQLAQHYFVVRVSTCGGRPVVLVDERDPISAIAADAEYVYVLTSARTIRVRR